MRWKEKPIPKEGSERIVKRFLILPLLLCGEWRWLETAFIKQKFLYVYDGYSAFGAWANREFVNEKGEA